MLPYVLIKTEIGLATLHIRISLLSYDVEAYQKNGCLHSLRCKKMAVLIQDQLNDRSIY